MVQTQRRWCSGIMQDSHSCDPGSIPGRRTVFFNPDAVIGGVVRSASTLYWLGVRGCEIAPRARHRVKATVGRENHCSVKALGTDLSAAVPGLG